MLLRDALSGGLGANPIEAITHRTGRAALVLLLVTLAVTPLRRVTGWNSITPLRRTFGLFAFFYAALHLLVYVGLDHFFAFDIMIEDVLKRPFITAGFAAFVLLVPLAVTSTKAMIRKLGRRWLLLHRLSYVAAALAVLHFFWKVKADTREPLLYAGALAILLLLRLPLFGRRRTSGRNSAPAAPAP
jgi:methionine sulfoxide reductase heme-binding subunit